MADIGYRGFIHKFGSNSDIDTAAIESVWDVGGLYPWPSTTLAYTIVSDDANDTAAGTGARTVQVEGVNEDFFPVTATVELDGLTPVSVGSAWRVFRAFVVTAGTNGTNVGNLAIANGGTTYAQITAALGQTQMAVYTIPEYTTDVALIRWWGLQTKQTAGATELTLWFRLVDGAWRARELGSLHSNSPNFVRDMQPLVPTVPPGTDMEVRAEVTANNTSISAGFDLGILDQGSQSTLDAGKHKELFS